MADNPNKKKADGKRTSKQEHEVAYQDKKSGGAAASKKATKSKK